MDIILKNVPYPKINPNSNLLWIINQGIKISELNIRYDEFCYEIVLKKDGKCAILDRFKCTEDELKAPNDWYFKFIRFQIWLDSTHRDDLINDGEKKYLHKIWDLIPDNQEKRKAILVKTSYNLFIEADYFQYHTTINEKSFINLLNGYNYNLYSLIFDNLKKEFDVINNETDK